MWSLLKEGFGMLYEPFVWFRDAVLAYLQELPALTEKLHGVTGGEFALAMNFFRLVVETDPKIQSHPAFHPSLFQKICLSANPVDFRMLMYCLSATLGFRLAIANNRLCHETVSFYSAAVDLIPIPRDYNIEETDMYPLFRNTLQLINVWFRLVLNMPITAQ
ncbi:hypothetical protein L0F63_004945 [Massospora cicadina]|nr:hypothetical protein L0F63_004945 [Massospora cicadina]